MWVDPEAVNVALIMYHTPAYTGSGRYSVAVKPYKILPHAE